MSTRRARIKAVAALPQRRKNVDASVNKVKQDDIKELVENVILSPKSRRPSVDKHSRTSPARAALPSPRKSPRGLRRTPDVDKVSSEWKIPTPSEKRSTTPLRDSNKPWKDMFVSPQARGSPLRKRSPVVRTPVIEVDIGSEKQITPHKRLLEIQESINKNTKVSECRENIESPKQHSKHVVGDYNSPSTPETAPVMDGIVPLKTVSNAPKPIDLLKSEIISDNVEVLFDPIVPLPSPTKVRQKLRPVPRLGPMRRNSVPGSASESEDESRRALYGGSSTPVPSRQRHDSHTSHSTMQSLPNRDVSRVRNDSVCSSVSQIAPQTPAAIGSPLREKNLTKFRRQDASRRVAAMRRRKESVQRDKLTMFDLIFYNPMTNPIVPDQDEIKAKEATKKEEEQRKIESKKEETKEDKDTDVTDAAPVPQIKLGPNGEIMLDEQSLVIKQSEQRKLSESVVREGAWMSSTSRVYRRTPRTADWSDAETVRFYRALAALGTDFSLMVSLFPGRTRRDLKLKFKKEERSNLPQIDKALRSVAGWDAERLETEFADERRLAAEKEERLKEEIQKEKKKEKERTQAMRVLNVKKSKGSIALGTSIIPSAAAKSTEPCTADDLLRQANIRKQRLKERRTRHSEHFATLTPLKRKSAPKIGIPRHDMATLHRTKPIQSPFGLPQKSPVVINPLPAIPTDIAPGSLVVLTVDDPKAPSQKSLHTYIKQSDGSITSIVLDSNVMSSLVSYVKNDTPKAGSSTSTASPCSVVSDRTNTPPVSASPSKRGRLSSYTIIDL